MKPPSQAAERFKDSDVAVIGLAGRFPGAPDAAELWRNLRAGRKSIKHFTDEELADSGIDPGLLGRPDYVKAFGVLDGIELFDAGLFGLSPREAEITDPQLRLFLECALEALENAGHAAVNASDLIGVYAGATHSSYLWNLLRQPALLSTFGFTRLLLGNDKDFLPTRVSYKLNLKGPSVLVQTACSTSLVAVHLACQSLLAGESDLALAGGVSIDTPQVAGYRYERGGVMSSDGHCRAFDEAADGTVNGSGVGLVVLKRLADAVADGDTIHAVILGSAINNDGAAKVGFTAPGVEGQAEAVSEALLMAGVEPETIGLVEAHGSGTQLGDPIEVAALTQAWRGATDRSGFCALGSVKTNIGHCNAAAGIAGLLKAVLSLQHAELPPSLGFARPNPQIDFAASPFYVNTRLTPWEAQGGPRRAAVSSFGLGGTNAHVVLEQAPEVEPGAPPVRAAQLLVLSARTPAALETAAQNLAEHLRGLPEDAAGLADVAWTLQTGRRAFEHRRIAVAPSVSEAAAALADPKAAVTGTTGKLDEARPVVFLFPGLGDQSPDMARGLYAAEPLFRAVVDECAERLLPELGLDLREVLFPSGPSGPAGASGAPGGGAARPRTLLRRAAEEESPAAARLDHHVRGLHVAEHDRFGLVVVQVGQHVRDGQGGEARVGRWKGSVGS